MVPVLSIEPGEELGDAGMVLQLRRSYHERRRDRRLHIRLGGIALSRACAIGNVIRFGARDRAGGRNGAVAG